MDRIINFAKLGHKVLLLCPDYSLENDIYPDYYKYQGRVFDNVYVKSVPTKRLPQRPESPNYRHWLWWNLNDYIRSFKPDIIDVEEPERIYGLNLFGMLKNKSYGKCIAVNYARKRYIPTVAFYHTNFPAFADRMIEQNIPTPYRENGARVYKMIYDPYDLTLCSCEDSYNFLKAHNLRNIKQGVFMGIDSDIFNIQRQSKLVEYDMKLKLLYVGRFEKEKDIKIVLNIFSAIKKLLPETVLYLAGKGEGMNDVIEASKQDIGVRYLGFLDREELVKVYNSVDIYFSPYTTDTFGLSVLEAMAKGLPVVVANEGGTRNLVDGGANGIACDTQGEFIRAIFTLATDNSLRHKLGANAKIFAEKYSGEKCVRNILNEYEQLIITKS